MDAQEPEHQSIDSVKILLLGLVLLIQSFSSNAQWTISGTNNEFTHYINRATIRRTGDLSTMWSLWDYNKVITTDQYKYLSDSEQREYDCKAKKHRVLGFFWFSQEMGNGDVVYSTNKTTMKWLPVESGTTGETLWQYACGEK